MSQESTSEKVEDTCEGPPCPSSSFFPASSTIEAKRIDSTSCEGQRLINNLNCTELQAITESDTDPEEAEHEACAQVITQPTSSRPTSASFLRPSSSQQLRPSSSQQLRPSSSSSQRIVPSFSRPSSSSSSRPLSAASSLLLNNNSLSHISSEPIPSSSSMKEQEIEAGMTNTENTPVSSSLPWFFISESSLLPEGGRLHVRLNERYITLFRHRGVVTAIDAICHHAGGPLTLGPLEDIEELGVRVVLCPWHRFMVTIDEGVKAYQGVDIVNGKPVKSGWKLGKVVQRPFKIVEREKKIYLLLQMDDSECMADKDACSKPCARDYKIYKETSTPLDDEEINNLSLTS